ncbi:hypothetical protein ROZALSC1DRAFT_30596 [Rozella allomycis CSF55]|uniref:alpha-1,2-Mannosidase n=1 Tax=Rozella allomycis (strain CSF55) TaxID=988480 RepID=A0A4P9YE16_ROZAC|nr:hypothetical protein ROZALSC1DRAFT_30596 [Rozella allomycis CSF55]
MLLFLFAGVIIIQQIFSVSKSDGEDDVFISKDSLDFEDKLIDKKPQQVPPVSVNKEEPPLPKLKEEDKPLLKENTKIKEPIINKPKKIQNEDTESLKFIKGMIEHAWNGYKKYAYGDDELRPLSKSSRNWITKNGIGATLIDSLDTLWDDFVSTFETTIRILGGLLSAYDLSGDERILPKIVDIADRLFPAFNSPNGIPYSRINLKTGEHFSQTTVALAELGTLQMEFAYVSDLTGNLKYREKALAVYQKLSEMQTGILGLFPLHINPLSIKQSDNEYSFGGEADSFYEYLLKMWIMDDKEPQLFREMYDKAIKAAEEKLVGTNINGYRYLGKFRSTLNTELEHLSCFAGGMIALGAVTKREDDFSDKMKLAADLTETCYKMYESQELGLSPESVDANYFNPKGQYYIQRPEVIESIFYMWRFTHEQKYRDWGLEIARSIEKHCKVLNGYVGYENILSKTKNNQQESFFVAETLKYLYLLFSDDSLLPLDKYVFNTEAHPFTIKSFRKSNDNMKKQ